MTVLLEIEVTDTNSCPVPLPRITVNGVVFAVSPVVVTVNEVAPAANADAFVTTAGPEAKAPPAT